MSDDPPTTPPRPPVGHEPGADHVSRRRLVTWLWRLPVLAAVAGGVWGGVVGVRTHFFKRSASATPRFVDGPTVDVAAIDDLQRAWDERTFLYGDVPGVLLHVPNPVSGGLTIEDGRSFVAFSRICTHLGCAVVLSRDPEAIAFATNVRVDGPRLLCRCHGSVFDAAQAARPTGGPARLPLPRVRIERRGRRIVATGIEPAPGPTG